MEELLLGKTKVGVQLSNSTVNVCVTCFLKSVGCCNYVFQQFVILILINGNQSFIVDAHSQQDLLYLEWLVGEALKSGTKYALIITLYDICCGGIFPGLQWKNYEILLAGTFCIACSVTSNGTCNGDLTFSRINQNRMYSHRTFRFFPDDAEDTEIFSCVLRFGAL